MKHINPRLTEYDLGITRPEYEALITVMTLHRKGELKIDMRVSRGDVCCIGAHMGRLLQELSIPLYVQFNHSSPLHPLFFPPHLNYYIYISDEDTQHAMETFLTTGDPEWPPLASLFFPEVNQLSPFFPEVNQLCIVADPPYTSFRRGGRGD